MPRERIQHTKAGTGSGDPVSDAVLTATRLLTTVSASSIADVDESITIPQFRVLVVLQSRGPMRLAPLAEILEVDGETAGHTVEQMVAGDLVRRTGGGGSGRDGVLELTDHGNDLCTEVTRQRREQIAEIVSRIPEDQAARLGDAAEAFVEAGGEPPATHVHDAWR